MLNTEYTSDFRIHSCHIYNCSISPSLDNAVLPCEDQGQEKKTRWALGSSPSPSISPWKEYHPCSVWPHAESARVFLCVRVWNCSACVCMCQSTEREYVWNHSILCVYTHVCQLRAYFFEHMYETTVHVLGCVSQQCVYMPACVNPQFPCVCLPRACFSVWIYESTVQYSRLH